MLGFIRIISVTAAKSLQSCPTLCDPIDGSPPGSPVPGILQPRTLEWVAIFSYPFYTWCCISVSPKLPVQPRPLPFPDLCPHSCSLQENISFLGCAQSRGPEEMVRLFITHPTGIWVHCDKGHKTCGLPMNRNPTRVPLTSTWLLGRASTGRKAAARSGGTCHLEPV